MCIVAVTRAYQAGGWQLNMDNHARGAKLDTHAPKGAVVPRYLTLQQAATYLSLSTKSLYRLVDSRRIPFTTINISTKQPDAPRRVHYRFDRVLLDAFMTQNAVIPPEHLLAPASLRVAK